jgi:dGTPase
MQSDSNTLASYASNTNNSIGRSVPEKPPLYRSEYQRDRDRIIHSTAFRRLEYKTQVFVNHAGDNYRTRLTHSLEVSQIARTIAKYLKLNEELTEAICLAHDLGHTPFGHAGQDALNVCMKDYDGFEHNLQSLRIVDMLEYKYPNFRGLNLMYETREGILKHCSKSVAKTLGVLGERFLKNHQPSLEAQLANIADQIAYNHHDIDDGLRSGILSLETFNDFEWASPIIKRLKKDINNKHSRIIEYQFVNDLIGISVDELITETKSQINEHKIASTEDVRGLSFPIVGFTNEHEAIQQELKAFLMTNFYQHESIKKMSNEAEEVIHGLFNYYVKRPSSMPGYFYEEFKLKINHEKPLAMRVITDYIAGMTDRFATKVFYNDINE